MTQPGPTGPAGPAGPGPGREFGPSQTPAHRSPTDNDPAAGAAPTGGPAQLPDAGSFTLPQPKPLPGFDGTPLTFDPPTREHLDAIADYLRAQAGRS